MNAASFMKPTARWIMPSGIATLLSLAAHADTLVLKTGQRIDARAFARQGDAIIVTTGPNGEAVTPDAGTPILEIAKVEANQPAVFKTAPPLLTAGKSSDALANVQAALKSAEPFGDLPGSHWPDLLVLQAHILVSMGHDKEAAALATTMKKTRNAGLVRHAQVLFALIAAHKGEHGEAEGLLELPTNAPTPPAIVAASSVVRGLGLLAKQQYPEALKSFLELPVFLPDETALTGIAQLGAAQAYYGMNDYDRAIAALESLIKARPGTPEIATAESLLPEWKRRRRVVEEAKDP